MHRHVMMVFSSLGEGWGKGELGRSVVEVCWCCNMCGFSGFGLSAVEGRMLGAYV